jgi:acetyl esterase/lipase
MFRRLVLALVVLGTGLAVLGTSLIACAPAADDPPAKIRTKFNVPYAKPNGSELLLDAYYPSSDGLFPAVLVVHGGAWRTGNKLQLALAARRFADAGMAAFAVNYRLAPEHKWPAQIHDCKAAVRWIRAHAGEFQVDPTRVGAYGYSAGGHLVAMLGACDATAKLEGEAEPASPSTRVQAVAAGGAPCDFRGFPPDLRMLGYWLGGTRAEAPDAYRTASPVEYVSPDDPPMFFFHGSADELVKLDTPKAMVDALREAKVESELLVIDGATHLGAALDRSAAERATQFLARHLHAKK